jgi:Xaa-Pro aminopeptidase
MATRDDVTELEFRERIRRVGAEARARSLDAVLVWSRGGGTLERHAEVLWLTNFYNSWNAVTDSPYWSGQAYAGALVTAADECVLITNIPHGDWRDLHVVCDAHTDDPFLHESAAGALRARRLEQGAIGLGGRAALAVDVHSELVAALPDVRWVVADDIVPALMERKSDVELEIVRTAGRVADAQMSAMLESIAVGTTDDAIARAGIAACIAAGGTSHSVRIASGPAGPPATSPPLLSWSRRPLAEGDLWRVDLAGAYEGYMFDFARSTVVGRPTAAQVELLEATIGVVESVIASIEPGRPIAEAARVGQRAVAARAPAASSRARHDYPHFGHSMGPGWGSLWLCEREQASFAPGMVFSVEVVIDHPSLGAPMFEQIVIVREHGAELVTNCAKRPWLVSGARTTPR